MLNDLVEVVIEPIFLFVCTHESWCIGAMLVMCQDLESKKRNFMRYSLTLVGRFVVFFSSDGFIANPAPWILSCPVSGFPFQKNVYLQKN